MLLYTIKIFISCFLQLQICHRNRMIRLFGFSIEIIAKLYALFILQSNAYGFFFYKIRLLLLLNICPTKCFDRQKIKSLKLSKYEYVIFLYRTVPLPLKQGFMRFPRLSSALATVLGQIFHPCTIIRVTRDIMYRHFHLVHRPKAIDRVGSKGC